MLVLFYQEIDGRVLCGFEFGICVAPPEAQQKETPKFSCDIPRNSRRIKVALMFA